MRHRLSAGAMRAIDAIHNRLESPADRLLRHVEIGSSYVVLPIFAFANAGVTIVPDLIGGHAGLVIAIVAGLVVGKPLGIVGGSYLAVRSGLATKPDAYGWDHVVGAGLLSGIGFTMSLFIASQSFVVAADFDAAKLAIFIASAVAAVIGVSALWLAAARHPDDGENEPTAVRQPG
jgi:NhaA family Na+:H+ antiporter